MTTPRYKPTRMPIDSDTYLYFDFQETAAPFVNQGSAGPSLNMVDVTGAGTGYRAGIRGPIFGGRGLALDDSGDNGAVRADGTAAWPSSELNVSIWCTITKYATALDWGRLFAKSNNPTTWVFPQAAFTFQFKDSTGIYEMDYSPGGTSEFLLLVPRDLTIILNLPHLIGFSHDGVTVRHYVDGVETANSPSTASPASNLGTGPWFIGNYPLGGSSPYGGVGNAEKIAGIIEEVRVCEIARDADWWLENWQRGIGEVGA